MSPPTRWSLIAGAASGDRACREEFVRLYLPAARAYLVARWRATGMGDEVDDAVQEVFMDCLRDEGALERADPQRPGGFRAFFYGLVRVVALRCEARLARRRARELPTHSDIEDPATGAGEAFDRAWAAAVMREAGERMAVNARQGGPAAVRRVDLLRARFEEGLAIRQIAARWAVDASRLHHDFAVARDEFRTALRAVIADHGDAKGGDVDAASSQLLDLLRSR